MKKQSVLWLEPHGAPRRRPSALVGPVHPHQGPRGERPRGARAEDHRGSPVPGRGLRPAEHGGADDGGGADGIVFALHNTPNITGSTGGAIGYNTLNPSLVIEFDTWQNGDRNDPTYDHLGLMVDGNGNHNADLVGPIQISATSANVEDCNDYPVTIDWNASTQVLSVFYDCVLRFSHTIDITNTIFEWRTFFHTWIVYLPPHIGT